MKTPQVAALPGMTPLGLRSTKTEFCTEWELLAIENLVRRELDNPSHTFDAISLRALQSKLGDTAKLQLHYSTTKVII